MTSFTPSWLSPARAAEHFQVSVPTVRKWIAEGEIYAERIGPRLIRVDISTLNRRPVIAAEGGDAA